MYPGPVRGQRRRAGVPQRVGRAAAMGGWPRDAAAALAAHAPGGRAAGELRAADPVGGGRAARAPRPRALPRSAARFVALAPALLCSACAAGLRRRPPLPARLKRPAAPHAMRLAPALLNASVTPRWAVTCYARRRRQRLRHRRGASGRSEMPCASSCPAAGARRRAARGRGARLTDRKGAPRQEMSENLEVVREVWGMHLAAQRNRIIRINLAVTVGAFALTACIVPASFFGMNLPHGLEARACELRAPFRFPWAAAACGARAAPPGAAAVHGGSDAERCAAAVSIAARIHVMRSGACVLAQGTRCAPAHASAPARHGHVEG